MMSALQFAPPAARNHSHTNVQELRRFLSDYQQRAAATDQNPRAGAGALAFPILGLFGEVGSLLSALKKRQRENEAFAGYVEAIVEEFGDALWYLANIASRLATDISSFYDTDLHDVLGTICKEQCSPRAELQGFEASAITLAAATGRLLDEFSQKRVGQDRALVEQLSLVFHALGKAAAFAGTDLHAAASTNLEKINSRWPRTRDYAPLFDSAFAKDEQLPRRIEMHVVETVIAGKTCVIQLCNGSEVGSPLTDNKFENDDYRFHDAFHLAYAATLGWSPCLRTLLRLKRKSDPKVDENEDGARATLTEEGVATFIFQYAQRLNYFATIPSLDYALLKQVQRSVRGYEVDRCPLWQWEEAILKGYEVFRQLRKHRQGVVVADLERRTLKFQPSLNDR
jgi:NTP pyrophosphatase (non-canonical NTP hydrolase)